MDLRTIIECLKYATTGELPPNSKGGAFIHDPSLCGEKEVLAQVKMRFTNTSGGIMVLSRRLQLTVKKSARQQKTLEGSLQTVDKNGERSSISSRVAELDQLMPQYLGVSKAILESVIFCHQDESLWPLSEPGTLKKKFDEIFEALKYTKAIDNIKKLKKTKTEDLRVFKGTESHTKTMKDQGDRAEKKSRALVAQLDDLRSEIDKLNKDNREADRSFRDAYDRAAKYESEVVALKNEQRERTLLQDHIRRLGHTLKERHESDEWLQSELDNYTERMKEHQKNEEEKVKQYRELEASIRENEGKLSKKHGEAGRYEEQKSNHEQQVERRKLMIKDTSRQHKIRGYDADLDDMQIDQYMQRISKLSQEQTSAVEKARRETEREIQKVHDSLNELGEQRSTRRESKRSAKELSATNEREIGSKQQEMNDIETDEGGKAILEDNMRDLQTRLKAAREDRQKASLESKINEATMEKRALEDENKQLQDDLIGSTKKAGQLAQLENLRQDISELDRNLDTMRGVHNSKIRKLVDREWDPQTISNKFQRRLDEKLEALKDAERQRDTVSRKLEQADYKLGNLRTEIRRIEKELATCVKHLRENIDGEPKDYHETLAELQQVRDELKADVDGFGHKRQYFSLAINKAQTKNHCVTCQRGFHGDEEQASFIKRMEIKMTMKDADQTAKDFKEAEDELRKAKEAGSSYETWLRLSATEIPKLQAEMKSATAEREELLRIVEGHDKTVAEREEAKIDVESLAKPVTSISTYSQERTNSMRKLEELSAKQDSSESSRTVKDIQRDMEIRNSKIQEKDHSLAKLRAEENRVRSLISTLDLDLSKAEKNLSTAGYQLEKKDSISKRIDFLRNQNRSHRDSVKQLDVELQELGRKITEEETKVEDIRQRGIDREKGLQQEASKLSDTVHKLNLAAQNIAAYADSGGPNNLARCQREIDSLERENDGVKAEVRQITVTINKVKKQIDDQESNKKTISENILYRQTLRELEGVEAKIATLGAQNAEHDRAHWYAESQKWKRVLDENTSTRAGKVATATALDNQLQELLKEWETNYQNAAEDYKKAHIIVETTKAAIEDLGRYGGALDKAIMKYHSIKMEEINRIIEELWKKTYRGTDVDTILIRSDNEAAKGNRSYNYRVCMVKQDTEMDMRGRCSAGQKVLASIIIRLALAECFGVNCGLIALDEPTTNLDRDNIRSLATALHDIIDLRRHQANFQLIVITHDEEFLNFMKCTDFCDHYWRIGRDERQNSVIQKQSIADINM